MLNDMMSPTEQAEPRGRGGHAASKEMKKYSSLLEEALAKGRMCLDCDGKSVTSSQRCLQLAMSYLFQMLCILMFPQMCSYWFLSGDWLDSLDELFHARLLTVVVIPG